MFRLLLANRLRKSFGGLPPDSPVELVGVGEVHAAFLTESRTREPVWSLVLEIRWLAHPSSSYGDPLGHRLRRDAVPLEDRA
jgi:hypothetical protein